MEERMREHKKYKVVGKFKSCTADGNSVNMIVIKDKRGACVMREQEWRRMHKQYKKKCKVMH